MVCAAPSALATSCTASASVMGVTIVGAPAGRGAPAKSKNGSATLARSRPSANAIARAATQPAAAGNSPPFANCPTKPGNSATASAITSTMSALRGSVPLITRLSKDSMDQANSLTARAPTIRPLPFRVWKARRTRTSASNCAALSAQRGNAVSMAATSSLAS